MDDQEFDAVIERVLQKAAAETFLACIEKAKRDPSPFFLRAYINGVLSAVAYHLTREVGPREAFEVFARLADSCLEGEINVGPSA
jgi:hypothetical protein